MRSYPRMGCIKTLAVAFAVAAAAVLPYAHAGLNGHVVTAQWHAESTPYKNYFDPHLRMAPYYNPAWLNTVKDTDKNIVVGPQIEFGWGQKLGHMVTLDMHDDGRLVLTLTCDGSNAECDFEDAHVTVSSTAFAGASLSLTGSTLTGRISTASLHSGDGVLEVQLHALKITTNGQTKTETCNFIITQPNDCAGGECCDLATHKPKPAGHVCRPAAHPCDIVEMCDGVSSACPHDQMTTDAEHCEKTADKITTSSHAAAPSSDAFGDVPHHDDIHGVPYDAESERSSGLRLNYLGLAALACVILYLVLKDKMGGKAKIGSPRSLPAHSRDSARW